MDKYTEEELATLTNEEREALLEDDGMAEGEADDAETDAADETLGEEGAKDGSQPEADDEDDGGKAISTHTPFLSADMPENAEQQLTEIATKKGALDTQFEDGDIDGKTYRAELEKLNKEETAINQQVFKANLAVEMEANRARAAWMETVSGFLSEHPEYKPGSLRYETLDTMVKRLAQSPDNAGKSGAEILDLAHERITSEFGGTVKADKKPAGKQYKPDIPPTLANVPSAEMTETGNSVWKNLDRLMDKDPIAYEAALGKLSDADRNEYLASQ